MLPSHAKRLRVPVDEPTTKLEPSLENLPLKG